ncbi:hypothetical protein HK102_009549 [Quaeritorhiza haematococci]|nr:hypothetical protein HK102_009549 [Quaeritorhiza haematococci]
MSPNGLSEDHLGSSTYAAIADIPLVLINTCKPPKLISLPYTYQPVSEDVLSLCHYDFSLERKVVADAEAWAKEDAAAEERRKVVEATRREKEREQARQRAPGLSEGLILQPTPVIAKTSSNGQIGGGGPSSSTTGSTLTTVKSPSPMPKSSMTDGAAETNSLNRPGKRNLGLNFLEFEQGLAPPDPWDTPQTINDDLNQLRDVISAESSKQSTSGAGAAVVAGNGASAGNGEQSSTEDGTISRHGSEGGSLGSLPSGMGQSMATTPPLSAAQIQSLLESANAVGLTRSQTITGYPSSQRDHLLNLSSLRSALVATVNAATSSGQLSTPPGQLSSSPAATVVSSSGFGPPPSGPLPPVPSDGRQQSPEPSTSGEPTLQSFPEQQQPSRCSESSSTSPSNAEAAVPETFSKSLQSMGFSPEGIERAIKSHGTDEKRVLDYLLAYDTYRQGGYQADDIDVAISLYESDYDKGLKFLTAYRALSDLGFPKASIREALVLKNNDRELALEYLMRDLK